MGENIKLQSLNCHPII